MSKQYVIDLEATVINELAKIGCSLHVDQWGIWHWKEQEIVFDEKKYLIGAYIKRDCITRAIEIYGQQCLPKQ
jgi:hypothetical protein